jgi:hypothetical protein
MTFISRQRIAKITEEKRERGKPKASTLKMNTALKYSTRVVQEGGRRCKKSTLNDLVHLTPLRIPLMNPPLDRRWGETERVTLLSQLESKTQLFGDGYLG